MVQEQRETGRETYTHTHRDRAAKTQTGRERERERGRERRRSVRACWILSEKNTLSISKQRHPPD